MIHRIRIQGYIEGFIETRVTSLMICLFDLLQREAKLQEAARVAAEPLTRRADDVAMNEHLKDVRITLLFLFICYPVQYLRTDTDRWP